MKEKTDKKHLKIKKGSKRIFVFISVVSLFFCLFTCFGVRSTAVRYEKYRKLRMHFIDPEIG